MKKIKLALLFVCLIAFCFVLYKLFLRYEYQKTISSKINASDLVDASCKSINPDKIVYVENLSLDNFTATGMTYDTKSNSFWIADHGTNDFDKLKLIELNDKLDSIVNIVEIENYTNSNSNNLQGITYDKSNDSFWLALGSQIQEINRNGSVINTLKVDKFSDYQFNGICYDESNDTLWVLCFNKYLINVDKKGNVLKIYESNFADQDMICMNNGLIYMTVGADYLGENNYCIAFNPDSEEYAVKYQLLNSYAVEGICFLDNSIYVVNDGMFHNAKIPKTYISIYND